MTPELWKTLKRWLEIVASILTVVGFVVTYWAVAVPFLPTIWKYGWPFIVAYPAFRIFQRGRSLYERFTGLELQVFGNAVDVDTRLEEQDKAHRDKIDELGRLLHQEIHNRKQFETQMDKKLKSLEEILRLEIKEREKVENQFLELKASASSPPHREPTLWERMSSGGAIPPTVEKKPPQTSSLADMTPSGLFALGASSPKRRT